MSNLMKIKQALDERLETLQGRVEKIEADICLPEDADLSEQAVQTADDEPLLALDKAGLMEIAALNATLARIEQGTYGTCVQCGEAIDAARLDALPTAALCIGCATDAEQRQHRL